MARRRRSTFSPIPRRQRVWTDTEIADDGFAEDALRSEDLLAGYIAAGGSSQGVTVVRTLIWYTYLINEVHTPKDLLTLGLIKGTNRAADVADPDLDPYADWAFHQTHYSGLVTGLVSADAPEGGRIDAKSSRKVTEVGETWWLVYKGSAPTTTTATYDFRARVRCLLLLP
jgi:hypothetical protein